MDALTIKDAAVRLGVSRQRVSQMLASGDLDGPPQTSGLRAPRNALRVYVSSVEEREARRGRPIRDSRSVGVPHESELKDDAYRLKVALDVARDQLARQRQQNERLTAVLVETVAALREEQALAREADRIAEEYSAIATNHLAPDSVSDRT